MIGNLIKERWWKIILFALGLCILLSVLKDVRLVISYLGSISSWVLVATGFALMLGPHLLDCLYLIEQEVTRIFEGKKGPNDVKCFLRALAFNTFSFILFIALFNFPPIVALIGGAMFSAFIKAVLYANAIFYEERREKTEKIRESVKLYLGSGGLFLFLAGLWGIIFRLVIADVPLDISTIVFAHGWIMAMAIMSLIIITLSENLMRWMAKLPSKRWLKHRTRKSK